MQPELLAQLDRARAGAARSTWLGELLRERLRVGTPDATDLRAARAAIEEAILALDAGRAGDAAEDLEAAAALLRGASE